MIIYLLRKNEICKIFQDWLIGRLFFAQINSKFMKHFKICIIIFWLVNKQLSLKSDKENYIKTYPLSKKSLSLI